MLTVQLHRLRRNPAVVGIVSAWIVGLVILLVAVAFSRPQGSITTTVSPEATVPSAIESPLPAIPEHEAPKDLIKAVIAFEEGLRRLELKDTEVTRLNRVRPYADKAYLKKLEKSDLALCKCLADDAREKSGVTITASLPSENITHDEDGEVYFIQSLVVVKHIDRTGEVVQEFELPIHNTTWRRFSTGWRAIDGN